MKNVLRAAVANTARASAKTLPGIVAMAGLMMLASLAQANEFAPVVAKSEICKDTFVPRQICHAYKIGREAWRERGKLQEIVGACRETRCTEKKNDTAVDSSECSE